MLLSHLLTQTNREINRLREMKALSTAEAETTAVSAWILIIVTVIKYSFCRKCAQNSTQKWYIQYMCYTQTQINRLIEKCATATVAMAAWTDPNEMLVDPLCKCLLLNGVSLVCDTMHTTNEPYNQADYVSPDGFWAHYNIVTLSDESINLGAQEL